MTTTPIRIWNTLGVACYAPFSLEVASWKSLVSPVLALIVSSILLGIANYFQPNTSVQLITYLAVWASIAWFALDFQQHLLLGAAGCKSESGKWRNYGVYFLLQIAVYVLWF